jgi:hypothetical protein
MRHFAIHNANSGFTLWFGVASSTAEALRKFSESVGGYATTGSQRLGVTSGTESQIAAVELWTRHPIHGLPKDLDKPTVYDSHELELIFCGREYLSALLTKKLEANDSAS